MLEGPTLFELVSPVLSQPLSNNSEATIAVMANLMGAVLVEGAKRLLMAKSYSEFIHK